MTNRTLQKHKKALQPFADLYAQIANMVEVSTDAQLRLLRKSVRVPTQTNCWWTTYKVAQIVMGLVIDEQARRKHLKKQKSKP